MHPINIGDTRARGARCPVGNPDPAPLATSPRADRAAALTALSTEADAAGLHTLAALLGVAAGLDDLALHLLDYAARLRAVAREERDGRALDLLLQAVEALS